jgi:hypothetical protein
MRPPTRAFAASLVLAAASSFDATAASNPSSDPYRWCAHYSGNGGNGSNCYFLTLEQCRAAVSGVGGYCGPNPFYTGPERPVPPPRSRPR